MPLEFKFEVFAPVLKADPIKFRSAQLAQEVGSLYANNLRLAIVRKKALATFKTLKSVAVENILNSGSRGLFIRHVTANRTWLNIQFGRRAGLKMPIKKVDNKFEPVPEMVEWFLALNIPKAAWFPILRKIARDGIKPRDIQGYAMRQSRTRLSALAAQAGRDIAETLSKTPIKKI